MLGRSSKNSNPMRILVLLSYGSIVLKKNKIWLMLVYYLVSNHQKQLVFIKRDIDLHSHYSSYLLRISFFLISKKPQEFLVYSEMLHGCPFVGPLKLIVYHDNKVPRGFKGHVIRILLWTNLQSDLDVMAPLKPLGFSPPETPCIFPPETSWVFPPLKPLR